MSRTTVSGRQRILIPLITILVTLMVIEGGSYLLLQSLGEAPQRTAVFGGDAVWDYSGTPFHQPDRDLFWRPVPGHVWNDVSINRHGYRGPEFELRKRPDVYRVVCLGNSVTFGFGVADEEGFVALLRRQLSERRTAAASGGRRYEVINAGVIGYSSWQGRRLCAGKIRALDPDLVVASFGYNDHHSARESDRQKHERRSLHLLLFYVRQTNLFRLVRRLTVTGPPQQRSPLLPRVSVAEFRENVLAIAQMLTAQGARCLFLTVPLRSTIPLVENFRAVDLPGGRVWVTPLDFVLQHLPREAGHLVLQHFLGGGDLQAFTTDERNCQLIDALTRQYGDLAILHYLRAQCLRRTGQAEAAAEELRLTAQLDSERRAMEAYNEALRALAAEGQIDLIDVAAEFRGHPAEHLLLDVVHPTSQGHQRIARLIVDRMGPR